MENYSLDNYLYSNPRSGLDISKINITVPLPKPIEGVNSSMVGYPTNKLHSDYIEGTMVHPMSDVGELMAQNQSIGDRIGNGLGRLVGTFATKTLQGVGHIAGVIPALWEGMDAITSNAIVELFAGLEEDIKEALPVYKTRDYLNGNIWKQMGTASFWMDDFIDGLAFMASMFVPGLAVSKGLKVGSKLAKLYGNTIKSSKLGKAALSKNANYLKNWAANADRKTIIGLSALSEAGFEAREVQLNIENSFYDQDNFGNRVIKINPETGKPYTLNEIKERSAKAARDVFIANVGLLMFTNAVQFDALMGMINKAPVKSVANVLAGATAKTSTLGYAKSMAMSLGKNIISEGIIEEGFQFALQQDAEHNIDNKRPINEKIVGVFDEWLNAFTDDEGVKAMVLGGLISFIPGLGHGYNSYRGDVKRSNMRSQILTQTLFQYKGLSSKDFFETEEINGESQIKLDKKGNPIWNKTKLAEVAPTLLNTVGGLAIASNEHSTPEQIYSLVAQKMHGYIMDLLNKDIKGEHLLNDIEFTLNSQIEELEKEFGKDHKVIIDFKEKYIQPLKEEASKIEADFNYASNIAVLGSKVPFSGELAEEFRQRMIYHYTGTMANSRYNDKNIKVFNEIKDKLLKDRKPTDIIDFEVFTYYNLVQQLKNLRGKSKNKTKSNIDLTGLLENSQLIESINEKISNLENKISDQKKKVLELKENYNLSESKTIDVDLSYIDKDRKMEALSSNIELEYISTELSNLEESKNEINKTIDNYQHNLNNFLNEEYKKFLKDKEEKAKEIEENIIIQVKENLGRLVNNAKRDTNGNIVISKEMKDLSKVLKDDNGYLNSLIESSNREYKNKEKETKDKKVEESTKDTTEVKTESKTESKTSTSPLTPDQIKIETSKLLEKYYNLLFNFIFDTNINKDVSYFGVTADFKSAYPDFLEPDKLLNIFKSKINKLPEDIRNDIIKELYNIVKSIAILQLYYANSNNGLRIRKTEYFILNRLASIFLDKDFSSIIGESFLDNTSSNILDMMYKEGETASLEQFSLTSNNLLYEINKSLLSPIFTTIDISGKINIVGINKLESPILDNYLSVEKEEVKEEPKEEVTEEPKEEVKEEPKEQSKESSTLPTIPEDMEFTDNSISVYLMDLLDNFPSYDDLSNVHDGNIVLNSKNKDHRQIIQLITALQKLKYGDKVSLSIDKDSVLYDNNKDSWENVPIVVKLGSLKVGYIQSTIYLESEYDIINSIIELGDKSDLINKLLNDYLSRNVDYNAITVLLKNEYPKLYKAIMNMVEYNLSKKDSGSIQVNFKKVVEHIFILGKKHKLTSDTGGRYSYNEWKVKIEGELNQLKAIRAAIFKGKTVEMVADNLSSGVFASNEKGGTNIKNLNLTINDIIIRKQGKGGLASWYNNDGTNSNINYPVSFEGASGYGFYVLIPTMNQNFKDDYFSKMPLKLFAEKVTKKDMLEALNKLPNLLKQLENKEIDYEDVSKKLSIPLTKVFSDRVVFNANNSEYTLRVDINGKLRLTKGLKNSEVVVDTIEEFAAMLTEGTEPIKYFIDFNISKEELEKALKEGKLLASISTIVDENGKIISYRQPKSRSNDRITDKTGNTIDLKLKVVRPKDVGLKKDVKKEDSGTIVKDDKKEQLPVEKKEDDTIESLINELETIGVFSKEEATAYRGKNNHRFRKISVGDISSLAFTNKVSLTVEEINSYVDRIRKADKKDPPDPTDTTSGTGITFATIGEVEEYNQDLNPIEAQEWWDARFPDIKLNIDTYNYLIRRGKYAEFHNAMVYISTKADYGIHYHEAFHVAFNLYTSPKRKLAIYKEAIKEFGIRDYSKLDELLAEEFRKYAIYREDTKLGSKIRRLFEELFNYMLSLLNRNNEIKSFFEDIYDNKFGNYSNKAINNRSNLVMLSIGLFKAFNLNGKAKLFSPNIKFDIGNKTLDIHEAIYYINSGVEGSYQLRLREKTILNKDNKEVNKVYFEIFNIGNNEVFGEYGLILPIFNSPKEQEATLNALVGLYPILKHHIVPKLNKKYGLITAKELKDNPELNHRLELGNIIIDTVRQREKLDSSDNNYLTQNQRNLLLRVAEDLKTNKDGLFELYRNVLQDIYKIRITTLEELDDKIKAQLEYDKLFNDYDGEEELIDDANPLTKAWQDEDLLSEPGLDKLSSRTREILGSLKKLDKNGKVIKNKYTGLDEYIDLKLEYSRLQHSLIGVVSMDDMMDRLKKASYIKPYLINLISLIRQNPNIASSLLTDFNRVVVNEETVNITNNSITGVKITNRVKLHYHRLANIWAESFKYNLTDGKFFTKEFLDSRDKYEKNYNKIYSNIRKYQKDDTKSEEDKIKYLQEQYGYLSDIFSKSLYELGIKIDKDIILSYINNPYDKRINNDLEFPQAIIVNDLKRSINEIGYYIIKAINDANIIEDEIDSYDAVNIVHKEISSKIYSKLNNIAELFADYMEFPIEFSYLGAENNQKYAVNDKNLLTEFLQLIKNEAGHKIILEKLTRFMKDDSMKYSNFMKAALKIDYGTGEFKQQDGEYILNEDFINSFDVRIFGGIDFPKRGKNNVVKNIKGRELAIAQLLLYHHSTLENRSGFAKYMLPTIADSGKNYTINLPFYKLRGTRDINTKQFIINKDGVRLKQAVYNTIYSELEDMKNATDLLFNIVDNRLELKEGIENNEYIYEHYHYVYSTTKFDEFGKPIKIFLDEQGKPTGRVFKFYNITTLNNISNIFNPSTGLVNITKDNIENDPFVKKIIDTAVQEFLYSLIYDYSKLMKPFHFRGKDGKLTYNNSLLLLQHPEANNINDKGKDHFIKGKSSTYRVPSYQQHLFAEYAINAWLANIQIAEMFLGKLSQFEEGSFTKRAKSMIQKGRSVYSNKILRVQNFYTPKRIVSDYKLIEDAISSAISITDPIEHKKILNNLMKPYKKGVNFSDGFSYTTTTRLVKQLQEFGAYENISHMFNRIIKNGNEIYYLKESLTDKEITIYLNSIKSLYTDRDIDGNGKVVSKYKKHSEFPLDPIFTKNIPSLEVIRKHMEDNNIDIFGDVSTEKNGYLNTEAISSDGININSDQLSKLPIEERSVTHDRVQLDVPELHIDKEVKLGLQIRKHILANINKKGRYKNIITGISKKGIEVENNIHDLIGKITTLDREKLEERLSIVEKDIIDKKENSIKNLYRVLLSQFKNRNFTQDIMDSISTLPDYSDFEGTLDLLGIRKQIVQILMALYTKNVLETKMPGMQLVNISNQFNNIIVEKEKKGEIEEIRRSLQSYKDKNGRIIVEVYIPAWSNDFYNEDGSLIDVNDLDDNLKLMLGYRIPSSAKHSAFIMKVVGFTPKEYGSIGIAPDSLMLPTGWDFDIDSFFVNRFNHIKTDDGKFKILDFDNYNTDNKLILKKQYQNELVSYMISVLGSKYSTLERFSTAESPNIVKHRDEIKKILGNSIKLNPYSPADQIKIFNIARAGAKGLGAAANTVTTSTILQKLDIKLKQPIDTILDDNGNPIIIKKLLRNNDNSFITKDGINIIQTLGEAVLMFVDSMKIELPVNLNETSFGVYSLMEQLMLGTEFSLKFLAQEVVDLYLDRVDIESTMEMLDQESRNPINKTRNEILTNLYILVAPKLRELNKTNKEYNLAEFDKRLKKSKDGLLFFNLFSKNDINLIRQFEKILGLEILTKNFNFSNKLYNISNKDLTNTLKLKVKYDSLSQEDKIEYWKKQYIYFNYYQVFSKMNSDLLSESLLVNADKYSPKTFEELNIYINKIKTGLKTENESFYVGNKKSDNNILNNIYKKNSKYPYMANYLANVHLSMQKNLSPLFITETPAFIDALNIFRNNFMYLESRELSKFSERYKEYLLSRMLDDHYLFNMSERETHVLLGISKDLDESSVAEKFIEYKRERLNKGDVKLSDDHWINYINPLISPNQVISNFRVHKLNALPIDATNSIHDGIKNTMIKDYMNGSIKDRDMIEDLIRYEFLTSGLTYSRGGLRRLIPNKLLMELGISRHLKFKGTLNDKNQMFGSDHYHNFIKNNFFNYKLIPKINLEYIEHSRDNNQNIISIPIQLLRNRSRRQRLSPVLRFVENDINKLLIYVTTINYERIYIIADTRGSALFFEPSYNKGTPNIINTSFSRDIGGIKLPTEYKAYEESFLTYGDFSNANRDSIIGTEADINMRKIADGAIVEVTTNNIDKSSSYTSIKEIAEKNDNDVKQLRNSYTYYSLRTKEIKSNRVIMLARNYNLKDRDISDRTKKLIFDCHKKGDSFILGNSYTDLKFIIYLQSIGAKYEVHGYKGKNRYEKSEFIEKKKVKETKNIVEEKVDEKVETGRKNKTLGKISVSNDVTDTSIIKNDIIFKEHTASGYPARTIENAKEDVTIAIAFGLNIDMLNKSRNELNSLRNLHPRDISIPSRGEKLTYDAVINNGKKYIPIDLINLQANEELVNNIVSNINSTNLSEIGLNIAGNTIDKLKTKYSQERIDRFVYDLLKSIIESPNLKVKIKSITTGGQTGIDEAGAKAGQKLGIKTTILAPMGWMFRDIRGKEMFGESKFTERFNIKKEDNSNEEVTKEPTPTPKQLLPAKRFKIDNHNILFVTELSEYENINYVTEYGFNENSVKNANELLDRLNENFPNTSSSLKTMLEEVKNGSENNIKRIKISPKLLDVLDISNQNYKNIQGVSFIVGKDSIVVFLYSKSDLSYDNNTSTLIDFNTNTLEANVLNKLLIFLYGSNLQFKNENMFSDIGVYLNDIIDENFSVEMLHDGLISDELRGYLKQIKYYEQMYEANKTEFLKNDMSKDQFMMLPDKVKDNRLNCI